MNPSPHKSVRVIYSGDVQGVGFRATTAAIAKRHPVTGYVRNCPNRTVELVISGPPDAVRQVLEAVAERFTNNITDQSESAAAPEPGTTFEIRR